MTLTLVLAAVALAPWICAGVVVFKLPLIVREVLAWLAVHNRVGGEPAALVEKRLTIEEKRTEIAAQDATHAREMERANIELQFAQFGGPGPGGPSAIDPGVAPTPVDMRPPVAPVGRFPS
jgi:hypothetical protein